MSADVNKGIRGDATRRRTLPALLGGIVPTSMVFFFGPTEIFFGNREEFLFGYGDFILWSALIGLAAAAAIAALILFLPDTASRAVFGITVWISVAGVVQSVFLNGDGGLMRDSGVSASTALVIIDTALWVVLGIISIGASIFMKKKPNIKPIMIIALITVFAMLFASCAARGGNIIEELTANGNAETEETLPEFETIPETGETSPAVDPETMPERDERSPLAESDRYKYEDAFLTSNGIDQVSEKNIVIFLIDRFDVKYYERALKNYPHIFDGLDGFTYFSDNVSLYSRTWPGVATMITGVDVDFGIGADRYFFNAYQGSPFLNDLKNDGWTVKIYTQKFYSYRGGSALYGIADNLSATEGYVVEDRASLVGNMISLSTYRYAPTLAKNALSVSSASFTGVVSLKGTGELFEINDPVVCGNVLKNGLTLDGNEKSYTFIHLSGCHSPYNMNEHCAWVSEDDTSVEQQLAGCMKMIDKYISEMKRLGVYDDATIVITGDHPSAVTDHEIPWQPRLTSLFVKPSGSSGTPLKYSKAQVSQDNLIPTLIESAGVSTNRKYGRGYFDVPEGENVTRHHKFELSGEDSNDVTIIDLEVTGDGTDFSNWRVKSQLHVGPLYK